MTRAARLPFTLAPGLAPTLALSLTPLALFGACSDAAPAPTAHKQQTIAFGDPAPDDGAVFFLEVTQGTSTAVCSATLVTPDLLLTAAHCLTGQFGRLSCLEDTIGAPLDVESFRVSNEPDLSATAGPDWQFFPIERVRVVWEGEPLCGRDVGLIQLQEPLPPSIAEPLAVTLAADLELPYRAVGYGAGHPSGTGERVRRALRSLQVQCSSPEDCQDTRIEGFAGAPTFSAPTISDGEFVGAPAACPGDSGGPALGSLDGGVIGVLSRGTLNCATNVYTRPQSPEFRAAVRELVELSDGSYDVPSWALEPGQPSDPDPDSDPDDPTDPNYPPDSGDGSDGGAGGLPGVPDMGGATGDDRPTPLADGGCNCQAAGTTRGRPGSTSWALFFLVLLGASRRTLGARVEERR